MLRILASLLLGTIVVTGAIFGIAFRGENLNAYREFENPQILNMFDETMLVVEAAGNPNQVNREVFAYLADFHIDEMMPLDFTMPPMRVRWDSPYDAPVSEWVGHYAIPVPSRIDTLPDPNESPVLEPRFETWQYGEVAQILHVGPYEEEAPAIERLEQFIADQGYETIGEREEVYLRGPAIWPPSKEKYTLIRYRVQRVGP